jgi:hypothetical protein
MDEIFLRIKGMLGTLKSLAIFVAIIAILLLIVAVSQLSTILKNSPEPQQVTIEQLAQGEIDPDRYVSVRGYALYEDFYHYEDENGRTVTAYYYIIDDSTGNIVVVRAQTSSVKDRTSDIVTLTGMTRSTPSDLRALIEEDRPILQEEGLDTNPAILIAENTHPPNIISNLEFLICTGSALLSSLTIFFFPSTVFAPRPIQIFDVPKEGNPGTKASGRFLALKRIRPTIEIGNRQRRFTRGVANIIPIADTQLMIYIHHVARTYVYGIKVSTQESDWGIFLNHGNVTRIEAGKLYNWKTRWAVRIQYTGHREKPESVVIAFDKPWGQTNFINLLRHQGFTLAEELGNDVG